MWFGSPLNAYTTPAGSGSIAWKSSPSQTLLPNVSGQTVNLAGFITGGSPQGYALSSGTLPIGMTLNESTGVVSGTPLALETDAPIFTASDTSAADADWNARISAPGVVWYHNFDSSSEMSQFAWAGSYGGGNDPLMHSGDAGFMTWSASGGPNNQPYIQILRKSATVESNINWWRPFSALNTPGNGKSIADPAGSGAVSLRTWAPTDQSSTTNNWAQDWYGPSTYQRPFYIQMRIMSDPNAFTFGDPVGKKFYLSTTTKTLTAQEVVTYAGTPFHRLYASGSPTMESLDTQHRNGQQIGGQKSTYTIASGWCDVGSNQSKCWQFGTNQWDTLLYCITPGTQTGTVATVTSHIQVWGANAGQTSYTMLWNQYFTHNWDQTNQYGWNAIACNTYHNNLAGTQYWQRYAQMIFSLNPIPCPQY